MASSPSADSRAITASTSSAVSPATNRATTSRVTGRVVISSRISVLADDGQQRLAQHQPPPAEQAGPHLPDRGLGRAAGVRAPR